MSKTPFQQLVDETAAIYGVKGERVLAGGILSKFEARVRSACIRAVRERWPTLTTRYISRQFGIGRGACLLYRAPQPPEPQPFPEDVLREFCESRMVGIRDIVEHSAFPHLATLRREAMREVAARCPQLSSPDLGRVFKRDHSTMLYALGALTNRKPADAVRSV